MGQQPHVKTRRSGLFTLSFIEKVHRIYQLICKNEKYKLRCYIISKDIVFYDAASNKRDRFLNTMKLFQNNNMAENCLLNLSQSYHKICKRMYVLKAVVQDFRPYAVKLALPPLFKGVAHPINPFYCPSHVTICHQCIKYL